MTPLHWDLPTVWHLGLVLGAAAVLHASFQVAVSVLTGLSARQLGFHTSHSRLIRLCFAYTAGVFAAVVALVMALAYVLQSTSLPATILWAAISGYGAAIGIVVILFYYREGKGTVLWLPRSIVSFLQDRIGKTSVAAESFSLGVMTVITELPFVIAPSLVAAMLLSGHTSDFRVLALILYGLVAILPLLIITWLVGGGKKISRIQKWRENNKGFLQFTAGAGLLVVSAYLFVTYCVGN